MGGKRRIQRRIAHLQTDRIKAFKNFVTGAHSLIKQRRRHCGHMGAAAREGLRTHAIVINAGRRRVAEIKHAFVKIVLYGREAKLSEYSQERRHPFSIFVQNMNVIHGTRSNFRNPLRMSRRETRSQDK